MKIFKLKFIVIFLFVLSANSLFAEEVATVKGMAGSTTIGLLAPGSKNADDIVLNWGGAGVGYGLKLGQHLFELCYFPNQIGDVKSFYYKDGDKITKIDGIERIDIFGLYYSPFFGPGFTMGIGYEQWEFRFISFRSLGSGTTEQEVQRDQIVAHATIVDIGYQIGGEDTPAFFSVSARASNRSRLIISGTLGYLFK